MVETGEKPSSGQAPCMGYRSRRLKGNLFTNKKTPESDSILDTCWNAMNTFQATCFAFTNPAVEDEKETSKFRPIHLAIRESRRENQSTQRYGKYHLSGYKYPPNWVNSSVHYDPLQIRVIVHRCLLYSSMEKSIISHVCSQTYSLSSSHYL